MSRSTRSKASGAGAGGGGNRKGPARDESAPTPTPASSAPATDGPSTGWWVLGCVCLLVSVVAAGVLSLSHLGSPPPGCGPQSACAKVTSSVWGRLPIVHWPTAFVGAAWFAGLLVGWVLARGRLGRIVWTLAGLGGAGSLLLIGVMVIDGALCPWCLASHAGNMGFLGVALLSVTQVSVPRAPGGARGVIGLAAVAILVTAGLGIAGATVKRQERAEDEATIAAATESIIAAGQAAADEVEQPATDGRVEAGPPAALETPAAAASASASAGDDDGSAFTGRWRIGPERAPIRFVVFMDYQCPDCRTVETELARLVAARTDVSLSIKHFPFNPPCNRLARSLDFNPHPNACWAARAAEAAGVLGGNDGFWRMHEALFARRGAFTDEELREMVAEEGFDPAAFVRTMTDRRTLASVEEDVEEGIALGLVSTPTLFVNGVELGGWRVSGALERTIERLAASDLPVLSAAEAGDQPPTAARKYLDAWAGSRRIPPAALTRTAANDQPAVFGGDDENLATVVIFGDLGDRQTRRVDARVRARVERDARVRYVFRHLPLDRACNPQAVTTRETGGCLAARLAIAAGRLGGPEAARTAHRTLATQPAPIDGSAIAAVATAAGVPVPDLAAAIADPRTDAALAEDVADAAVVRTGRRVVTVIVAGRIPSRLEYDSIDLLQRIIDRARDEG